MRKISILTINFLLVFSLTVPSFTYAHDINNHWAEQELQLLIDRKVMEGDDKGNYLPNRNISRAAFTKLLLDSFGIKVTSSENPFQDVKKGAWYYAHVITASKLKIVEGDGKGNFNPEAPITRQAIATMLNRALENKDIAIPEKTQTFADNKDIGTFAKEAVQNLSALGIITGVEKNGEYYFNPRENATRAATATMLIRILDILETPQFITKTTLYDYDFKTMVDKQLQVGPQTDNQGKWFDAGRKMVEYYTNPTNFKYFDDKYQFLVLSGSSGISEKDINNKILKNKGILSGKAGNFLEASKQFNVNEIYLISHAMLETGNGTSALANGIKVGLNKDGKPEMVTDNNKSDLKDIETTYNMYGVGAYDSCPEKCGSERAYEKGWFTPEKAIIGGAEFISDGYITEGQDTLYKMRWNPEKASKKPTHQYATDVGWAAKQTGKMKEIFNLAKGLKGNPLVFEFPSYKNQPAASREPQDAARFGVNTELAGKKAVVVVSNTTLNVRKAPGTNFAKIGELTNGTKVTIIGHNRDWYKIKTGKVEGWVSGSYLKVENGKKAATFSLKTLNSLSITENMYNDLVTGKLIGHVLVEGTPLQVAPKFTHNVIMELSAGTKVTIVEKADGWYKVSINGQEGWLFADYLQAE